MDAAGKRKIYRLLYIAIVGILSLCGFGMLFLSQLIHFINKPSPSASTTGNIYVTRPPARRQHAQCAIIFEVDGKKYEVYSGCSWYRSGDEVTVIYNPSNPYKATIDARNVGYTFGAAGLVLAFLVYLMSRSYGAILKKEGDVSLPA